MKDSLFPYPGSKRYAMKELPIAWFECDTFIDPFFGAGAATFYAAKEFTEIGSPFSIITAEKDASIRAIVHCLSDETLHSKVEFYAGVWRDLFLLDSDKTFAKMKDVLNGVLSAGTWFNYGPVEVAAVKLFYQRIAFGSVARTGSDGKTLNVNYSPDKCKNLRNWKPTFIPLYKDVSNIYMLGDWTQCFDITLNTTVDYSRAIAFLDPPYWMPKKTGCYPGHDPKSLDTLALSTDSVSLAMRRKCRQVVLCNYGSDVLSDHVYTEAKRYSYTMDVMDTGSLDSLAYGRGNYCNGNRTQPDKTKPTQLIWILNRMS